MQVALLLLVHALLMSSKRSGFDVCRLAGAEAVVFQRLSAAQVPSSWLATSRCWISSLLQRRGKAMTRRLQNLDRLPVRASIGENGLVRRAACGHHGAAVSVQCLLCHFAHPQQQPGCCTKSSFSAALTCVTGLCVCLLEKPLALQRLEASCAMH